MRDLTADVFALIEEREDETAEVERALHDEISQTLTAAGMELEALRLRHRDQPELAGEVVNVQRLFEDVLGQVRALSQSLPPSALNRVGLPIALERLVAAFRREGGPVVRLMQESRLHIAMPAARAFHRITRLALDNAIRHASARKVEVLLRSTARGLVLEVRDDGRGFDPAAVEPGLGLSLMRYSAEKANLEFRLDSTIGAGTIVFARDISHACPPAS